MSLHDRAWIAERLATVTDPIGFLTNLFAHAPVGFAVWTADGRPLLTNQAFIDIFGSEPPPGYNVLEDDILRASGMLALFQRAFAGETVQVPTFWFDPRDLQVVRVTEGRRVAISMTIFPLFKPTGEIDYVAATYKDETELVTSAETAAASERRFRGFSEAGIIGIVVSDLDGNIKEANDEFLRIVGYSREDFQAGLVSSATLNTADRDRTDAAPRADLKTKGVAHAWEKQLVRKDGTLVSIVVGSVVTDRTIGESLAFVLDQTPRKRAEAERRESDARKSAVMEAALDPIVIMDAAGRVTEVNDAAVALFGHPREAMVGELLADTIVPARLRDAHTRGLARYLATGEPRVLGRRIELTAVRADGTELPVEVAVVRSRSEGAPIFTGYIRDLTERRLAEQAQLLRREKEAAEAANQELEAFSYSVAHDLRSPLRAINGFSTILLEDHQITGDAAAQLRKVVTAAARMDEMIDALLGLSRLSRGELQLRKVNISELAKSIVESLRTNAPERHVELALPDNVEAYADPELLRIALENLIGNAWKFTRNRPEAHIEVGAITTDVAVRCHVRDDGAGFDMKYAQKLFGPFQRLHPQAQFEGHGIGLATVQRIVRRHGGRVWAESAPDRGATFYFELPLLPSRL